MIIETPTKKPFIQFSKYIRSNKNIGLKFDFPLAAWSTRYFERLKEIIEQRGYEYHIERTNAPTSPDVVSEFITVDLKQDLERARDLIRLCLQEVFHLRSDESVILYFVDVSPKEEKVGF